MLPLMTILLLTNVTCGDVYNDALTDVQKINKNFADKRCISLTDKIAITRYHVKHYLQLSRFKCKQEIPAVSAVTNICWRYEWIVLLLCHLIIVFVIITCNIVADVYLVNNYRISWLDKLIINNLTSDSMKRSIRKRTPTDAQLKAGNENNQDDANVEEAGNENNQDDVDNENNQDDASVEEAGNENNQDDVDNENNQDDANVEEAGNENNQGDVEAANQHNHVLLVNIGSNNITKMFFTNIIHDQGPGHDNHDIDGNIVDTNPDRVHNNATNIVDVGLTRLQEGFDRGERNTICGSFEKRNSLFIKNLMMILSNLCVASFTYSSKGDILHILSSAWHTVIVDVSIIIFITTGILIAALLVQIICLKVCVTTQILVENISKLGIKAVHVLRSDNVDEHNIDPDNIKCWYATSIHIADITIRSVIESRDVYKMVKGGMIGQRRQCESLKVEMEKLMSTMSENAYRLTGSNLTGVLVFYIALHCSTSEPITGIFVASVGLFVASAWYTLAGATSLIAYAGYLVRLRTLTIEVNLTDVNADPSRVARESATLQSGRHVAWSEEDNAMSNSVPVPRFPHG